MTTTIIILSISVFVICSLLAWRIIRNMEKLRSSVYEELRKITTEKPLSKLNNIEIEPTEEEEETPEGMTQEEWQLELSQEDEEDTIGE